MILTGNDGIILITLFCLPLLSAILLMLIPSKERSLIIGLTGIASSLMFIISIYIFLSYDFNSTAQYQGVFSLSWVSDIGFIAKDGIQLKVGIDGIAASMILLTGIVILAGTIVSWKIQYKVKDFFILLYILVAGVFGTFTMLDLFFWFLLYETAVLPMYLLIGVWGSTRKEYDAMKLMMMLVAGSILIFAAIFMIFTESQLGTFDMELLSSVQFNRNFQIIVFPLVAIGCGTLGAMFPFHAWSPDGHASAPTAVSMLHAGVLMKLGAFGIIRLGFQLLPEGGEYWGPGLMTLGIIAALYGAISALKQTDLKLMTGFSSISHMGYVFLGLGTYSLIGISGAVLQMFAHGVMTALFFLLIGAMYDQSHNREIPNFSGLAARMPIWSVFFVIAGLASLGLPGLSGFVAELHIFIGTFQSYPIIGGLAVLTAAITATYLLRMFSTMFFGEFNEKWNQLNDMNYLEKAGALILTASILFLGLWPSPWMNRIADSIQLGIPGVLM
jgi:NADH-quinone oxidoreductase subunit M